MSNSTTRRTTAAADHTDPGRDCPLCPRLVTYRAENRAKEPDWHNAPVPSFGALDAELLIVGLAPGVRGANRTGRPFTGDYAGVLLYHTLLKFGFATGVYLERPMTGSLCATAASPTRCAACRRRTCRHQGKIKPATLFS